MPRDLMHRGPREPGPRAAWEFHEVWLCNELDAEEKEADEDESQERKKERTPEAYEAADLPPFEVA